MDRKRGHAEQIERARLSRTRHPEVQPNNDYLATEQDAVSKKWEQDVVPLLR